jgi:hypothetical protein
MDALGSPPREPGRSPQPVKGVQPFSATLREEGSPGRELSSSFTIFQSISFPAARPCRAYAVPSALLRRVHPPGSLPGGGTRSPDSSPLMGQYYPYRNRSQPLGLEKFGFLCREPQKPSEFGQKALGKKFARLEFAPRPL